MRQPLLLHNVGARIGRYTINQIVGYGNFGAVYEATAGKATAPSVALKQTFDPSNVRSFQGEFAALHSLSHANLPQYIEIFEDDGDGYLVMEFVPGQSLEEVIVRQQGPLPEQQVLAHAVQLCDVLAYLHSQAIPIFHRDIKPANVRLTAHGLIKLVDFGLLKQGIMSTRTSRRALTPAYAPIEQWGGQGTTAQSDIYSLGATLYHLLTGKEPPIVTDRVGLTSDPLVAPRQLVPTVSVHVSDAIMKAIALAQKDRFADASTFKHALQGIAASLPNPRRAVGGISGPSSSAASSQLTNLAATPASSAVTSATIRVPSAKPELIAILPHESDGGRSVNMRDIAYSPDSQILATTTMEGLVRFWRVADQKMIGTWGSDRGIFEAEHITYSPDGSYLAIGGGNTNGILRIVRANNRQVVREMLNIPGGVESIAFSTDERLIAIGTGKNTVQVWTLPDGLLVHTLWGHSSDVDGIGFSRDSQLLLSADYRETRLWNVSDGRFIGSIDDGTPVTIAPDGKRVALKRGIWRLADRTKTQEFRFDDKTVFSPDWQFVATPHYTGKIEVRHLVGNQLVSTLEYSKKRITCIAYSPNGLTLAVCHDDAVLLWRL